MGSKRVGLARTQALIENLKRELSMGGSSLAGLEQSKISTQSNAAGSQLADSAVTHAFTTADHGKIFTSVLQGNFTKKIELPADTTVADVGTKITLYQAVTCGHNSCKYDIRSHTGNKFAASCFIRGFASNDIVIQPDTTNGTENKLVISMHGTNSAFDLGSSIVFTCVAAGEWHLEILCEPKGSGNAAFAYSAV